MHPLPLFNLSSDKGSLKSSQGVGMKNLGFPYGDGKLREDDDHIYDRFVVFYNVSIEMSFFIYKENLWVIFYECFHSHIKSLNLDCLVQMSNKKTSNNCLNIR